MECSSWLCFNCLIMWFYNLVFLWKTMDTGSISEIYSNKRIMNILFRNLFNIQRIKKAFKKSLYVSYHAVFYQKSLGIWKNLNDKRYINRITIKQDIKSEAAVCRRRPWNRLSRTSDYSGTSMMTTDTMMMNLAIPDYWIDSRFNNDDDRSFMNYSTMAMIIVLISYSSELLLECVVKDVASSSISKNTHPFMRDLGKEEKQRTCDQYLLIGKVRTQRHDDGVVVIICTKCIQLVLLSCLIVISTRSVLRVTASLSLRYFHRLFLCLFY